MNLLIVYILILYCLPTFYSQYDIPLLKLFFLNVADANFLSAFLLLEGLIKTHKFSLSSPNPLWILLYYMTFCVRKESDVTPIRLTIQLWMTRQYMNCVMRKSV